MGDMIHCMDIICNLNNILRNRKVKSVHCDILFVVSINRREIDVTTMCANANKRTQQKTLRLEMQQQQQHQLAIELINTDY